MNTLNAPQHMNLLCRERNASVEGYLAELCKVRRDIDRAIQLAKSRALASTKRTTHSGHT